MRAHKKMQTRAVMTLVTLLLAFTAMTLTTSCASSGGGYSKPSKHYRGFRGYGGFRGYRPRPWGAFGGGVIIGGGDPFLPDLGAPEVMPMDMGSFDF